MRSAVSAATPAPTNAQARGRTPTQPPAANALPRGQKRERDDAPPTPVTVNGHAAPQANGGAAPVKASGRAGVPGARPRPVKKQRLVSRVSSSNGGRGVGGDMALGGSVSVSCGSALGRLSLFSLPIFIWPAMLNTICNVGFARDCSRCERANPAADTAGRMSCERGVVRDDGVLVSPHRAIIAVSLCFPFRSHHRHLQELLKDPALSSPGDYPSEHLVLPVVCPCPRIMPATFPLHCYIDVPIHVQPQSSVSHLITLIAYLTYHYPPTIASFRLSILVPGRIQS